MKKIVSFSLVFLLLSLCQIACRKDISSQVTRDNSTVAATTEQTSVKTTTSIPPEAWSTLAIIDKTGKPPAGFKGGTVFQNREGLLPKNVSYKEWDIARYQPGVNRGPRRLVTGNNNSAYYTADHYASFIKMR